ncbi:MAG: thiamine ABC transporter substrate-binding protein [Candidatus Limnocylindrales bacterium]
MFDCRSRLVALIPVALVLLVSCAPAADPSAAPTSLVLLTHDSFAVSEAVLERFEAAHGVDVQLLKAGDAGAMVNQAILTKDAPLADVLYGVDNTFLSRALDAGIFDAYSPAGLASVDVTLTDGTQGFVSPIDYGDVCINIDKEAFAGEVPPPAELLDLIDPAYKGMLVVENPATSSPGLAFLLATIGWFEEEGDVSWPDFWRGLRDNDVLVVDDWDTAYLTSFSGGASTGDRPIVVSYATSPVAEVVFADPPVDVAPTAVLTDGCFRQIEYAGVLHGSRHPEVARAFVDFMLSAEFQADIPLNMFVFPASNLATIPAAFTEHAAAVPDPVTLDPAEIAANRERWVTEWTDAVLH